ncbi:MAG: shikimate dehydrogenase [Anaerolineae bacterium]|jgi:shikimate dehydrogenase
MTQEQTQLVALVGWPVEHSVSPAMQNAAFRVLGLPWRYTLLPTPHGKVQATLTRMNKAGYRGANITVPHKQAVLPCLDGLDSAAQLIGAVNTIAFREDRQFGYNTDADGFLSALREAGFEPGGHKALVLGAGGAARAVVYALTEEKCPVTILNRTVQRAAKLARQMQDRGNHTTVTWVREGATLADLPLDDFDLLVNATSVGMWPEVDASPYPEELQLPSHWTVFDLVYNPEETRLLVQARAAGATSIGGLGMLIHQGARSFELWTGYPAPIEVMRKAAQEALSTHSS